MAGETPKPAPRRAGLLHLVSNDNPPARRAPGNGYWAGYEDAAADRDGQWWRWCLLGAVLGFLTGALL